MSEGMGIKILCVDDDEVVVESLRVQLEVKDYEVVTASSGKEGLSRLAEHPDVIIIISDMYMPGMDGAEFLAKVHSRYPDTVRILLTANADFENAIRAVNEGFIFRFLIKPLANADLYRVVRDATEEYRIANNDRELLENKLAELGHRLVYTERLATLGTLAAGVGHELKNLTTVLFGALDFIAESAEQNQPPEAGDLEKLRYVGNCLEEHTKHLMNLGRPPDNKQKVEDLIDVTMDTIRLLKTAGKIKHLQILPTFGVDAAPVLANRMRLEQILVNLIGNAADAVAGQDERTIMVNVGVEGDRVHCSIADNGCGIPGDKLATIFQPYFTTKKDRGGTGLGLSVCKQLAESLHGTLAVESTLGSGSTFTLSLPVAANHG